MVNKMFAHKTNCHTVSEAEQVHCHLAAHCAGDSGVLKHIFLCPLIILKTLPFKPEHEARILRQVRKGAQGTWLHVLRGC